jgi:hypothetical protein
LERRRGKLAVQSHGVLRESRQVRRSLR